MPQCFLHLENYCTTLSKKETHEHKPFEECFDFCPYPHWGRLRAEEWWQRWCDEPDLAKRKKIEEEAR